MSRQRKPEKTEAEHRNGIKESLETYTKHSIECWVCCGKESDRDMTAAKFSKDLYKMGWRYIESNKYATEGIACPECAAKKDKDR